MLRAVLLWTLTLGLLLWLVLAVQHAAELAHAQPALQVADETPKEYLYDEYPDIAGYADCIINGESSWNPDAWNPTPWPPGSVDHAAGLGGFIYSTWLTTPQGRAGRSRYDPYAAIDAVAYMLYAGRAREFGAVAVGWC